MKSKAFIHDYPVNFRLLNSKKSEHIYIEDTPASAYLEIKNESGIDIYFAPTHSNNIDPGPDNFHFALTFQPGVLKTSIKSLIKHKLIKKGWVMSIQTQAILDDQEEVYTIIYLLNKNKDVLRKDETLYFALKNLNLDCEIGSQISQVELDCKHLSHNENFHSEITSKTSHYNLTLINHRGLPFMPLHVGFTDINTVLNNKNTKDNNLSLRITNLQSPNPDKDHHFLFSHRKHSKIYLFFDTDDAEQSYAIATNDEVEAYEIEIRQPNQKNGTYLIAEPAFQGDMPIWEIAPQDGDVILEPHGHINEDMERVSGLPDDSCFDIDISKIITNTTNGITHLRLRFENIPGFWDHTFSIPIVKQPLIIKDHSVGIGTSEPIEKLEVKGDIFCNASNIWLRGRGDNAKERLRLHHNGKSAYIDWNEGDFNVRNHTNTKLSINPNGNVNVTGAIVPSTGNTENKGIMFPKDPGGGRGDAAWIRYYARSGEATTLEIGTSNDRDDHIALMSKNGNVGIGTTTPDHKLEIGHYKDINDNYLSIRTAGGSKYIAGIKLQHYNNSVGWSLISDDKTRDFHIKRYYNNTEATEAISIKGKNGNVGIGTSSPKAGYKLDVNGLVNAKGYKTTVYSPPLQIKVSILPKISITGIENYFNVVQLSKKTAYVVLGKNEVFPLGGTTSDRRLKENINSIKSSMLKKVMKLRPVTFNYKVIEGSLFYENSNLKEGFIADELQEVIPAAVEGEKNELTSDGKIEPQTVNTLPLVAVLTKAMQEQQNQIEKLQTENQQLKVEQVQMKKDIAEIKKILNINTKN